VASAGAATTTAGARWICTGFHSFGSITVVERAFRF
jgi:hypothetical protein